MNILSYVLTSLFLLAGMFKLGSAKPMKDQFEEFGLPKQVMWIVGALEIIGAIGVQVNELSRFAAIGLLLLMIGAMINHIKVKHSFSKIFPSLLLFILLAIYLFNQLYHLHYVN